MTYIRNSSKRNLFIFSFILILTIAATWVIQSASARSSENQMIQDSWNLLRRAGQYEFSTSIEQITYPAPRLSNVGSSSIRDIYYISGWTDLTERSMEFSIWQNQGSILNQQDKVDIRVEDGEAWGRTTGTAWQELESFSTSSFAPGNDAASFLIAAKNIVYQEQINLSISQLDQSTRSLITDHYSFDIDSHRFANYMRDQMVEELQRAGKLPHGMNLSTSDQYRDLVASGETWINEDGLPLRIKLNLEFPPEKSGEQIAATITTDFNTPSRASVLAALPVPLALAGRLGLPTTVKGLSEMALPFELVAVALTLGILILLNVRRRVVQGAIALLVMTSIVVTPLWQSAKAESFYQDMQQKQEQAEAAQAQKEKDQQAALELYTSDWDPQANPMDTATAQAQDISLTSNDLSHTTAAETQLFGSLTNILRPAAAPAAATEVDETAAADFDQDGLTDEYENSFPDTVLNWQDADTDDDRLNDGVELKLGMLPGEFDSDGDLIPDKAEVESFVFDSLDWYTNPMSKDTDKDGLLDGAECPQRVPPIQDPATWDSWIPGICQDTDLDNIPDIFDRDDDGDGVPSIVDSSPTAYDTQTYTDDNPFKLKVTNLISDSIFITYQLKPTNPEHLTYALNVLDWPTGDIDGQINRVSDTTFASQMTPEKRAGDPKASNGDMRLLPMIEVRLMGTTMPLPLTNTFSVPISFTTSIGEIKLTGQSGNTVVSLTSGPAGTYHFYQALGNCNAFSSPTLIGDLSAGAPGISIDTPLGTFADGQRVLVLMDTTGTNVQSCANVYPVAHGTFTDQVIDAAFLEPYGASVRDDAGHVIVYAPLSLVYDYVGATPTAFQSKLPFTNSGSGFNDSQQEVRIIWLLQMMTDDCKPQPANWDADANGEWCSSTDLSHWNTDITEIVHTYTDTYSLSGVSVEEEHGVDMTVIIEDPVIDPEPQYDDPLWGLSHALQSTFAAGRDSDGDGARDITVADIKNRFDVDQNNCPAPDPSDPTFPYVYRENNYSDFGLPCNAFQVERYHYPYTDAVYQFMSSQVDMLFDTYYNNLPAAQIPASTNLLFAREINLRSVMYGESSVSCPAAGDCTFDFSGQPVITQAVMNWAPYQNDDGDWISYPLQDYLDVLEANLRQRDSFQPEDDSLDAKNVVDGQIYMARSYYEGMYRGIAMMVALNNQPTVHAPSELSDANIYGKYFGIGQVVTTVINTLVDKLIDGLEKNPRILASIIFGNTSITKGFLKAIGESIKSKLANLNSKLGSTLARCVFWAAVAIVVVAAAVGLVLYLAGGDSLLGRVGARIMYSAISVVTTALAVASLVSAVSALKAAQQVSGAAKAAAIVGLVIGVVVAWVVFFISWDVVDQGAGSLAVNNLAADAMAATATIVLFTMLALTGYGAIAVAIIGIIDGLIALVCYATGQNEEDGNKFVKDNICSGISGWVTKIFKWILYSQTFMIDYDNTDRLQFNNLSQDLSNPLLGMAPGNTISYTLGVTNTITLSDIPFDWKALAYFWQYSNSAAKSSTFTYKIQPTEVDIHDDLERFTFSDNWQATPGDDQWQYNFPAKTDGFSITMPEPGINQAPVAYLAEGSAVPVQECWAIPQPFIWPYLFPVCYVRTEKATINSDLGSSLKMDVFPATLDAFYSLAEVSPGAVSLAWGREATLTFPVIQDADGDGLISASQNGNDPNDALFDTDNDGVSDYYEVVEGLNPRLPDSDGDGLNDAEELRQGTDPKRQDSDGDGLPDKEEIQGWLFTYDFTASGIPLETQVYSDPLIPDTDYDGVTDLLEKVYGFNPNVPQNANVLEYALSTHELDAPLVALRFDESTGSTVFADSSNFGFSAACQADACPLSGVEGRFAQAVHLDGDDALNLSTSAQVISLDNNRPFTLAGWVYPESGGAIISKWNEATDYRHELIFSLSNGGALELQNSAGSMVTSSGSVPANTWSHVAVSFDGSQASFYINGALSSTSAWSNPAAAGTTDSEIMLGAFMGAASPMGFFTGKLDEITIFDRVLSNSEILDRLMVARYNFDDQFVRPGEDIHYVSVIENLLNSRFAYGLLTTLFNPRQAIVNWAAKLQPTTFVLWPDNPVVTGVNTAVISDTLQIDPGITQSGDLTIDQTVNAQIVDRRSESNFAELWLKLNEGAAATSFEDSSGNMPPRNVTCTTCPTSGESGILNTAVKYTANTPASIPLPDLDTMRMVNRGYTAALWVNPATVNPTDSMTLLKGTSDQLTLTLEKNVSGDYIPHVYVNGSDRTPALNLWRVIIPDVWNHLAVRYSPDQSLDLFINGARVATLNGIPAIANNADLTLGSTQNVDYWVDDVRLFSRPLSTGDINRLAERPVLQLKMDAVGFPDSSVYAQNPTQPAVQTTLIPQNNSIRGTSLQPGSGSNLGYLQVNGNQLLNMQDGAFTFSVWVNPASTGGNPGTWQGIFGWNSGDNDAFPTLERNGNQLRFSFGNGIGFHSSPPSDNVLTPDQWNHVVVTFEPELDVISDVPTGRYLYSLYVNGQIKAGYYFNARPTTTTTLYVGHSSTRYTSIADSLYVTGIGGDAGSYAEVSVFRDTGCLIWCDEKDVQGTNTYNINLSTTKYNYETTHYWVWEYDWGANPNDFCGDAYHHWYDLPGSTAAPMSDGISGALNITLSRPSSQFFGLIDELEVYRYPLDSEQVFDLYNSIPLTTRLPLDDRPASDSFDNTAFVGVQDNGVCSGSNCPAAGTIGLINQAVRFDGTNDFITVPMVQTTSNYMVSLWVNTHCANCGLYTLKASSGGSTLNQLYLKNGNVCALTGSTEMCSQGGTLPDEQWHHVVYSNNGSIANLWLDGSVVNTISGGNSLAPAPTGQALLGYAEAATQDYLNGQIDDVRVFRESQDASVVAQLKRRAPLALFPLDEATTDAGMQDSTPQDWVLDCANGQCPQVDRPGRLSTAAEFDGVDDLFSLRQAALSQTTQSLSVGVWVMPSRVISQTQTLWVLSNTGDTAPKYSLATAPDGLRLCVLKNADNGTCTEQSNVDLIQNTWNFVLLTVNQPTPPSVGTTITETISVYINGYLDFQTTGNVGTAASLTGLGRLYLGNKPSSFNALAGGPFGGKLDEASVYEYQMNEIDVRDTFHYQMAQVEEYDSLTLTIDADNPNVNLVNYDPAFPYFPGTDTLMHVNATDPTSGVSMVEMQVQYQGTTNQAYQVAPVCLDSLDGSAYCPSFQPDTGDGTYTLSFRAVDRVGHQSNSQDYPVYVDAAGPRITSNQQNSSLQAAQQHPSQKRTWVLPLSGTILDEQLSDGVAGSGVELDSVRVTIRRANGDVVGAGTQIPQLTPTTLGYNWNLDYLFPEKEPTGKLYVEITARDKVGNKNTRQFEILLDATPPVGKLNQEELPAPDMFNLSAPTDSQINPAYLITGTLSGAVSDVPGDDAPYMTEDGKNAASGINQVDVAFTSDVDTSYLYNEPYPDGLLAWLPLDSDKVPVDESGNAIITATQRLFLDISPYQMAGECQQPDCPQPGVLGHKMGSTYFAGSGQYINMGQQVDLENHSFTVSIWAKRDATGHNDPMLWQGPFSVASRRFLFGLNAQNHFVCGFGGTDLISPQAYLDTNWHQWACTFDLASGGRTLYRDGQAIFSDTSDPIPAMYENLLIGLAPVGSFLGYLDELVIYDYALDASQMRRQYTGYNTVYHLTVDENFYADGDTLPDSSGYFNSALLQSFGDPFNKVVAGKVGLFALTFDGNDRLEIPEAFNLGLDRGAFTQAAWIFPEGGSGERDIISQRNANPEERYPSLILTDDNGLMAGFGNLYNWNSISTTPGVVTDQAWNFIVACFDGNTYRLYVNGVQQLASTQLADLKPYPARQFNIGDHFSGSIDDVRIYPRALDALEIQALMSTDWRETALDGTGVSTTWTANVLKGLEGPYHIGVRGWDAQNHYDTGQQTDNQWGGLVDTLAPRLILTRQPDPVPSNIYTVTYTFSIEDTMLDESSILENMCSSPVKIEREYYNSSWYLAQGNPPNSTLYRIQGECQGDIRQHYPVGITACDLGGNCSTANYPAFYTTHIYLPLIASAGGVPTGSVPSSPLPKPLQNAVFLFELPLFVDPAVRFDTQAPQLSIHTTRLGQAQVRNPVSINLQGSVFDANQVRGVQVQIFRDELEIYTVQAAVYGDLWNAPWVFFPGQAPANGIYTLQVTATDEAGNESTLSQPIQVVLIP